MVVKSWCCRFIGWCVLDCNSHSCALYRISQAPRNRLQWMYLDSSPRLATLKQLLQLIEVKPAVCSRSYEPD
eukprot:6206552-Amphidinium_carterae.1